MQNSYRDTYQRQKKQAKTIIQRINNNYYHEVKRRRSQGFQIAQDFRIILRQSIKKITKRQTQNQTKLTRRRQLTEQIKKSFFNQQGKSQIQSNEIEKNSLNKISTKKISFNKDDFLKQSKRLTNRMSSLQKQQFNKIINQIQQEITNNIIQYSSSLSDKDLSKNQQVISKKNQTQIKELQYHQKKNFLPMLQMYIEDAFFQKSLDVNQKKIKNIVTQVILIALNRRNNGKLLDAIDILIQINQFIPKKSILFKSLKTIWYQLIAKIFLQIKAQHKKPKKQRNKIANQVNEDQSKRKKTIMIRSMASQRTFLNKITHNFRKMQLIYETDYNKQSNMRQRNNYQIQQRMVASRLSQKIILGYPEPSQLFGENISNYGVVVVRRDKQTSLYPIIYPISLKQIINQKVYSFYISKINTKILPQKRCFDFDSFLYVNYLKIFFIFFSFIVTYFFILGLNQQTNITWLLMIINLILLIFLTHSLSSPRWNQLGKQSEVIKNIKYICKQWQSEYDKNIKIKCTDELEALVISYTFVESQSQIKSNSTVQMQKDKVQNTEDDKILQRDKIQQQQSQVQKQLQNVLQVQIPEQFVTLQLGKKTSIDEDIMHYKRLDKILEKKQIVDPNYILQINNQQQCSNSEQQVKIQRQNCN